MLLTAANAMKVYFVCTFSIMPKISLPFVVSARVAADPRVSIFHFLFCYETMSSCSQNCWFDWNSAVLFHMWLLLATILCTRVFEIWSPRMRITKKKKKKKKSALPHRFWCRPMIRNQKFLFWPERLAPCLSTCTCMRFLIVDVLMGYKWHDR